MLYHENQNWNAQPSQCPFRIGGQLYKVSQLKKQVGHVPQMSYVLPYVLDTSTLPPQPEAILARRVINKGNYCAKHEILVKWVGTSNEDATWKNQWHFSRTYPDFILEDKDVPSEEE
ncbi:hypothetical protein QYF36_000274 [Acer negundo]|nr:hypothetical protein QYF36_000274 [Acer negundo]